MGHQDAHQHLKMQFLGQNQGQWPIYRFGVTQDVHPYLDLPFWLRFDITFGVDFINLKGTVMTVEELQKEVV